MVLGDFANEPSGHHGTRWPAEERPYSRIALQGALDRLHLAADAIEAQQVFAFFVWP